MKKQNELSSFVYPDKQEIKAAQLACCGRYCTSCESPAEYAWRKREVDMSLLLERAIHKELTETEKNTVMLHWYEGKSLTQISKEKGISAAAVKQTLDRANDKLEKVLSYAICYQQNIMTESIIPLAVGRARVIASARNSNEASAGERIARLKESQCLSCEALSSATGISVSRLLKIEKGAEIDVPEIIALSEFFDVTTDYILKGEKITKKKTLRELGLEYEKEAEKIKRIIAAKRDILKCGKELVTANELFEVKRELKCLYTQYRETVEIAEYLKSYYVPHTGRRELFSYK